MGTQQGLVSLPQALEHQEVPCLERWDLDWTSHVNGAQVGKWRPEETCRQESGRRTGGSLPTSQTQPSVSLGIKWRKHFLLHQMLWRLSQIKRRGCRAQYLTFVCVQELLVSVTIVTSRSYNPFDFHHILHTSKEMGIFLRTKEALFSRAYKISHITGVLITFYGTKQNSLSRYISLESTQLTLIFKVMEITWQHSFYFFLSFFLSFFLYFQGWLHLRRWKFPG